jgi:hypothetical protein
MIAKLLLGEIALRLPIKKKNISIMFADLSKKSLKLTLFIRLTLVPVKAVIEACHSLAIDSLKEHAACCYNKERNYPPIIRGSRASKKVEVIKKKKGFL